MRVATRSRKVRSWVMVTTLPLKSISRFSSHSMESRSRWLVGSSSSSTSGRRTSAWASATRFLVPPESVPIDGVLVQVQPVQGFVDALLPVPAVLRLDGALQLVEVALAVAVLRRSARSRRRRRRGWPRRPSLLHPAPAPAPRRRCAGPAAAAGRRRPAFSRPARILSSEDLPAPLRPIRPTRSPASSEKSAWSSRATWPKASCALRRVMSAIGGRDYPGRALETPLSPVRMAQTMPASRNLFGCARAET